MKLKQKFLAATIAAITTMPAMAETVNLFSDTDMAALFEQDVRPLRSVTLLDRELNNELAQNLADPELIALSDQEMRETDGAVAPLVYIGFMTGARFVIRRVVTQKTARSLVAKGGTNVLAPNRSIAKNIAGKNHFREFHSGPGKRYTHYHPTPRNGSHVWYGKPR